LRKMDSPKNIPVDDLVLLEMLELLQERGSNGLVSSHARGRIDPSVGRIPSNAGATRDEAALHGVPAGHAVSIIVLVEGLGIANAVIVCRKRVARQTSAIGNNSASLGPPSSDAVIGRVHRSSGGHALSLRSKTTLRELITDATSIGNEATGLGEPSSVAVSSASGRGGNNWSSNSEAIILGSIATSGVLSSDASTIRNEAASHGPPRCMAISTSGCNTKAIILGSIATIGVLRSYASSISNEAAGCGPPRSMAISSRAGAACNSGKAISLTGESTSGVLTSDATSIGNKTACLWPPSSVAISVVDGCGGRVGDSGFALRLGGIASSGVLISNTVSIGNQSTSNWPPGSVAISTGWSGGSISN